MIWFEHCSVKVNFNVQGSDTKTFFGLWVKSNVQDWSSINMTALLFPLLLPLLFLFLLLLKLQLWTNTLNLITPDPREGIKGKKYL